MRRPFTNLTLDERRVLAQMLQARATTAKLAHGLSPAGVPALAGEDES